MEKMTLSLLCCSIYEFIKTFLLWMQFLFILTFIVFADFFAISSSTHFPLYDLVFLHLPHPLSMVSSRSCYTTLKIILAHQSNPLSSNKLGKIGPRVKINLGSNTTLFSWDLQTLIQAHPPLSTFLTKLSLHHFYSSTSFLHFEISSHDRENMP